MFKKMFGFILTLKPHKYYYLWRHAHTREQGNVLDKT